MYEYVKDKEFLKESHSMCANLVNQLVQELKKYDIDASMSIVGSGRRGLITQNGKAPVDYDFNLWIWDDGGYSKERELKDTIIEAFNYILKKNGRGNCFCKDSTSVISTQKFNLRSGNKTSFSIDLCIVKEDDTGRWYRLIHQKTGIVQQDQWFWNPGPNCKDVVAKEEFLKENNHWNEVREAYLDRKNMYLTRNDYTHPSFKCYLEVINELYNKYNRRQDNHSQFQSLLDVKGTFLY